MSSKTKGGQGGEIATLGRKEREIMSTEEKEPVHLDCGKREGRMRLRVGLCGAVGRAAGRVTRKRRG